MPSTWEEIKKKAGSRLSEFWTRHTPIAVVDDVIPIPIHSDEWKLIKAMIADLEEIGRACDRAVPTDDGTRVRVESVLDTALVQGSAIKTAVKSARALCRFLDIEDNGR